MRTLEPRGRQRSVPIEVAEAWRDEALAAQRERDSARDALDAAQAALQQVRAAAQQASRQQQAELEEARAAAPVALPPPPPADDGRVVRLAADLANVRRHRDEAVASARRSEKVEGLRALAEVYDDLQRSLDAMDDRSSPWFSGHTSILGKVRSMLRQGGARPLGEEGQPFDPKVHEAVGTAPGPAGQVAQVEQPGFELEDGTLVRPARVRVGDGAGGGMP